MLTDNVQIVPDDVVAHDPVGTAAQPIQPSEGAIGTTARTLVKMPGANDRVDLLDPPVGARRLEAILSGWDEMLDEVGRLVATYGPEVLRQIEAADVIPDPDTRS